MISAFHYLRVDGTKPNYFRQRKKATAFGWEAIEGMLKKDIQRIHSGQLARVPSFKESFVHHHSWTWLNVKPVTVGSLSLSLSPLYHPHNMYTKPYSNMIYITYICTPSKSMFWQNWRSMLLKFLLLWIASVFTMSCSTSKPVTRCLRRVLDKGFIKNVNSPLLASIKDGLDSFQNGQTK